MWSLMGAIISKSYEQELHFSKEYTKTVYCTIQVFESIYGTSSS